MKKLFTLITAITIAFAATAQTKKAKATTETKDDGGYDIKLTMTPAKNQKAYLACFYGKGKALIDSCQLDDKCVGHFKGSKKLTEGIYILVSQAFSIQDQNVLIGKEQHFSITGDTTKKEEFAKIGSPDNDLFKTYSAKSMEYGKAMQKILDEVKTAKTKADTLAINKKYRAKQKELNTYRDELAAKHEGTLLAALLNANRRPDMPEVKEGDSVGTIAAYRFVKEHYWDDVDFADARLLRTPFFEQKIDEYLKYYVSTEADSIYPEIKYFLLGARESKEMYAYLLTKFTNKYMNPEYMGQDKVFVHLFTDYFLKGDTSILDPKSKKTIIDRGYSMMLGLVGNPASSLDLTDTTGKVISMYGIKNKYTLVVYWSPTCGHCRQELPVLDSIYKAKWKDMDVKVYSIISKDDELAEMKKFIKEKDLAKDWLYTYETKAAKEATERAGVPNFRQAYDFNKTPILYLLDSDKKIMAKQLDIKQIDDILTRKSKMTK